MRSPSISILNSYLLLNTDSPISTTELSDLHYQNFTVDALIDSSIKYRPFLTGIKEAKQKEILKQSLAEYDYYPNVNLALQYSFRDRIEL